MRERGTYFIKCRITNMLCQLGTSCTSGEISSFRIHADNISEKQRVLLVILHSSQAFPHPEYFVNDYRHSFFTYTSLYCQQLAGLFPTVQLAFIVVSSSLSKTAAGEMTVSSIGMLSPYRSFIFFLTTLLVRSKSRSFPSFPISTPVARW